MSILGVFRRKPEPKHKARSFDLAGLAQWLEYQGYTNGYRTTMSAEKAEPIALEFVSLVNGGLKSNGIIAALELIRFSVFSEARFQYQRLRNGRPAGLFGTDALRLLERPFSGGTTGDLLARVLMEADLAGNSYRTVIDDEIVRLRPDWTEIVLAPRIWRKTGEQVGFKRVGYAYYEGGPGLNGDPVVFAADEVSHYAPYPDPLYDYRGMSWLTPIIREIQADVLATKHKLKFFENAATPNLAVSLPKEVTPDKFEQFVDAMDAKHKGVENAYKTLYTAGGADVTVVGSDLRQLDFKVTQGAGETRIAAASGVGAVIAQLSEGMQGSSLNAGNFGAARRRVADGTFRPLWRSVAGAFETLVGLPPLTNPNEQVRLWYDDRDIAFLREDEKDAAEIQLKRATTLRTLVDAGYHPDAAVEMVDNDDVSALSGQHSGLFSVQLQEPGTGTPTPAGATTDEG